MRFKLLVFFLFWSVFLHFQAQAANLEAGFHAGLAVIGDETVLGRETGIEYGVWLLAWPSGRIALAADWAFLPRSDFQQTIEGFLVGEEKRNRQQVDVTVQVHFLRGGAFSFFVECGGGALWNNRQVINPSGFPGFEEHGKESTRKNVYSVGAGIHKRLLPHLNWMTGIKAHNLGRNGKDTTRLYTGLTFSLK